MTQEAFEKLWADKLVEIDCPYESARRAYQAATAHHKEVMEEVREAFRYCLHALDDYREAYSAEWKALDKLTALLEKE